MSRTWSLLLCTEFISLIDQKVCTHIINSTSVSRDAIQLHFYIPATLAAVWFPLRSRDVPRAHSSIQQLYLCARTRDKSGRDAFYAYIEIHVHASRKLSRIRTHRSRCRSTYSRLPAISYLRRCG